MKKKHIYEKLIDLVKCNISGTVTLRKRCLALGLLCNSLFGPPTKSLKAPGWLRLLFSK